MKKLRFLIPVFSFGLILAYAWASQFGNSGLVAVSEVYAHSSKNFTVIVTPQVFGYVLLVISFFGVPLVFCLALTIYRFFKRGHRVELELEEKPNEDQET